MTWYTDNFYYLHHTHIHTNSHIHTRLSLFAEETTREMFRVNNKPVIRYYTMHLLASPRPTCDATVDNYAHLALTALQVSDLSKPIINETFLGSVY